MDNSSTKNINFISQRRRKEIITTTNGLETIKQTSIVKSKNESFQLNENKDEILDKVKKIMQKKVISINEIHVIAYYLNSLDEFTNYLKTLNDNYGDLIVEICYYLKGKVERKNEIIFKYGDKGGVFYIILDGTVSILKTKELRVKLSEDEYLIYLSKCKRYEEYDILNQCLSQNMSLFDLDEDWISWLRSSESQPNQKIISKLNKKNDFYKEITEILFKGEKLNPPIDSDDYIKRMEIVKLKQGKAIEKPVIIYQYYKLVIKETGGIFGEISSEKNNMKRTATIFTENDCFFGTLDKTSYENCLKELNERQIKKAVDFFLSSKLFFGFNKKLFEIKLYHCFVLKKIERFDRVIVEGEEPKFIYIIKKGEFEVTAKMNLLEFNDYVYYFKKIRMNNKLEDFLEKEKIENDKKFKKYLTQKHLVKITIAKSGDVLGLDDMIYKNKYAFSAECVTALTEVFILEKKNFEFILNNYIEIRKNYQNFVNSKVDYLVQRLISMKETKVNIYNYKNDEIEHTLRSSIRESENKHKPSLNFSPQITVKANIRSQEIMPKRLNFTGSTPSIPITDKFRLSLIDKRHGMTALDSPQKNNNKPINLNFLSVLERDDNDLNKGHKKRCGKNSVGFNNNMFFDDGLITKSYSVESKKSNENNETKELIYQGDANLKKALKVRTLSAKNRISHSKFVIKLKNFLDNNNNPNEKSTSINFKDSKIRLIDYSTDLLEKASLKSPTMHKFTKMSKFNSSLSKINIYNENINTLKTTKLSKIESTLIKEFSSVFSTTQNKNYFNVLKKEKNLINDITFSPSTSNKLNPVNILKERQTASRVKRYKKSFEIVSDKSNIGNALTHFKIKQSNLL